MSQDSSKASSPPATEAGRGTDAVAPGTGAMADGNERHFSTEHLVSNLKHRTLSSGFLTGLSQGVQFVLTLASTMVLARLLEPHDFGLLAMLYTVMSFLRVFREAGLSMATVQKEGITHAQVSNLFWINVGVSGFISLLMVAASPLIAWFYREPQLVPVTIWLSMTFVLAGLGVQHMALLNRQMRFKAVAVIQIGSTVAGFVVGVAMAWQHYAYWSLVGMNLTTSVAALVLTWSLNRWRPQFFTRDSGTRALLHFGANLTGGAFLYSLARGLDGLLIGRVYGAAAVGYYSRAAAMLSRPLEQFMTPIEAVFIPAFSRLQNRPDQFRQNFLQVYETIALGSFAFTGMCFAMAHPLTMVLLGAKWEKTSIIFAGFTFAALQYPLTTAATWLFTCQGRGRDSFHAAGLVALTVAISFVAGLPFGPAGVAISYSASCLLIQLPIMFWIAGRAGPVTTAQLWGGFLKQLPVWLVVALVSWLVRIPIPDEHALLELLLAGPASLLTAGLFILVYPPSRKVAANVFDTLTELKLRRGQEATEVQGEYSPPTPPDSTVPGMTVIIPTFNRRLLLERAIDSALAQTHPPGQIIVVDDGSTDGTAELCRKYGDRIEYVFQPNSGVSRARNRGVRLARCAWVGFLDSDDHWTPNFLARVNEAIIATGGKANFYFADMQVPGETAVSSIWTQIGFKISGSFRLVADGTDWMFLRRQPPSIQATVFSTAALRASGGFDLRYRVMEDTDLFFRLGVGQPVCAVNLVGCVLTADDHTNTRLTTQINAHTEPYWIHSQMLWASLRSRHPGLSPLCQRLILNNLADAHWRLFRFRWHAGQFAGAGSALLGCLKTYPAYPLVIKTGLRPGPEIPPLPVVRSEPAAGRLP